MTKTNNVTNKVTRKLLAFILAFATMMTAAVVSPLGTTVAQAATFVQGNQELSITDGMAVLRVNGNNNQLTNSFVVIEGGMYTSTYPIAVTLWQGNTLFAHCYDLQGNALDPLLVDTGVISLIYSGDGTSKVVTGYVTSTGQKSLPTFEQLRAKWNGTSNGNTNNGNTNNGNTNNGNTNNSNTNNGTNNGTSTGSNTSATSGIAILTTGVAYNDGYTTYTLYTGKTVITAVKDSYGTIWCYTSDGSVYYWSYSLERLSTNRNMHLYKSNTRGLVVSGYATGYYDSNGTVQHLLTPAEISTALSTNTNASTNTKNNIRVVTKGTFKILKKGDDTLDTVRLKKGTVTYGGKAISKKTKKNVSTAVGFSWGENHYMLRRDKLGRAYVRINGVDIRFATSVVGFVYNPERFGIANEEIDTGLIYGVKLKDGTYVMVPSYY